MGHIQLLGAYIHAGQVFDGDLALRDLLDLQSLSQGNAAGAVQPVVDLALADSRREALTKFGLRQALGEKVVFDVHNHIMC